MAGTTDHYGLTQIEAGESFSTDGYKYTKADRQTIDTLAYLGAEGHHHTGEAGFIEEPSTALNLSLSSTGGTIPAGTRVYYKYTYVNERGEESIAGPEAYVDTPDPVDEPSAPTLTRVTTGGTLLGGNYYYVLSEYVGTSINESRALNPAFIAIPSTTSTNMVTLTMPSIGLGDGWNIYRRKPGQNKYFWLDSVDSSTPEYDDTGSVTEDCDRTLPTRNSTNASNSIVVTLPGATPTVPESYTWRLYRTYTAGNWSSSLLSWIVEETSEASGIITPTYTDVGLSTQEGTFPEASLVINSPSKILLTDGAEVEGVLPANAVAYPVQIEFGSPGALSVASGTFTWLCDYPAIEVIACRAHLGRGSVPASTDVIVDVNAASDPDTPVFATIFTTQANRPRVLVGDQVGARAQPDIKLFTRGAQLSVDIDQTGGGATPTDSDLVVTIYMMAYQLPLYSFPGDGTGWDLGF